MSQISYTPVPQDDQTLIDGEVVACRFSRVNLAGFYEKIAKRKGAITIFVSFFVLFATIGISVGLGSYALFVVQPHAKVDFSLQAFAIPDHEAWKRWNAFKNAFRGQRVKRSAEESIHLRNLSNLYYQNGETKSSGTRRSLASYGSFFRAGDQKVESRRHVRSPSQLCGDSQYQQWQKMYVVYLAQGDGENIFTEDRIEEIHKIEQQVVEFAGFKDFCLIDLKICDCVPIGSILRYFYPSHGADGLPYPDGGGSKMLDIHTALNWALSSSPMAYVFTDGRINSTFHESRFLRSEILFGRPQKGYSDFEDRRSEQKERFLKFAVPLKDFLSVSSTKNVKVLYGGTEIFDYEVDEVFWNDLRLSIISVVSIVVFVFVLTSFSLWLTFWGIATILLSFPLAFFFYRYVFNIVNVGLLNGVAAFVIIGIGVDDVFVFINTFRQSSHIEDVVKRIRHTIWTAGKATFFTSFTTAAAFAANISSSIPAVHQFGLFMTLIVTCCWLLVILMMPPVIVIWHRWFRPCEIVCCFCCLKCKIRSFLRLPDDISHFLDCHQSSQNGVMINGHDFTSSDSDTALLSLDDPGFETGNLHLNLEGPAYGVDDDDDDPLLLLEEEVRSETRRKEDEQQEGCNLNVCFQGLLYYYVALPVIRARVVVAVIFVGLLIISIGCFSQIRQATKPPQLFRPETNLQQLLDLMANYSDTGMSCNDCLGYSRPPATVTSRNPVLTTPTTSPRRPPSSSPCSAVGGCGTSSQMTSLRLTSYAQTPMRNDSVTSSDFQFPSSTRTTTTRSFSTPSRAASTPSAILTTISTSSDGKYTSESSTVNPCHGNQCDDIQDHPPLESGITVYVVFGIKGANETDGHVLNDQVDTIYDDEFYRNFQFKSLNISDLCRLCKLIINATDLVLPNTSQCWPSSAAYYIESFLSEADIKECRDIPRRYLDEKGSWRASQALMGFDTKGIRWISFSFRATTYKGHSSFEAYKKYQKWESLMSELTASLPKDSPLRSMYQTSEFWKQVMMEVVAVSSAIYGLVLSMLICVIAVGVFTGHVVLLLITVVTMIGLVSFVLAVFFWAGWELGGIEAVSLSILVGSSVDYCVHIVEGYLLAGRNPPSMDDASLRKWRTGAAIGHIGTSVVSSAITTIMAAIPLTQTILMPFSRFGQIVALNTTVAIVYALTSCVAFLSLFAPARFTSSVRSAILMMVALAIGAGLLFLLLFIISRCGVSIPSPSGQNLF